MYRPVFSDGQETNKSSSFSLMNDSDDNFKRVAAEDAEPEIENQEVVETCGVWPFLHNQHFQSKEIVLDA